MAWPLLKTIVPQKFHRIPRYPVIPLLSIYPYMAWLHPRSVQDRRVMVNVVHWRMEWQTTSVFLPGEPHERYEKGK